MKISGKDSNERLPSGVSNLMVGDLNPEKIISYFQSVFEK